MKSWKFVALCALIVGIDAGCHGHSFAKPAVQVTPDRCVEGFVETVTQSSLDKHAALFDDFVPLECQAYDGEGTFRVDFPRVDWINMLGRRYYLDEVDAGTFQSLVKGKP